MEALLESRDRRAACQQQLLQEWPASSLICLTVQPPGPVKRSADSLIVGGAALAALLGKFGSVLQHVQVRDLETGYEAYLVVPLPELLVKRICCGIEDTHPLGRLMDIDVLPGPLDRESVGLPPRRCLLCDNEVRYCMRARTHTTEELLAQFTRMVRTFSDNIVQNDDNII